MLNPASSPQIYSEVPKLLALPSCHISLNIPLVIFASIAEQPPVMTLVTMRVAKLCANACGTMKIIKHAYIIYKSD